MIKNILIVIGVMLLFGLGINARFLLNKASNLTFIVLNIMWGVFIIFVLIFMTATGMWANIPS